MVKLANLDVLDLSDLSTPRSSSFPASREMLPRIVSDAAALGGKYEVEAWLRQGGKVDAFGDSNETLLSRSICNGQIALVRWLLSRTPAASIDLQHSDLGFTPLMDAVQHGHDSIVTLLLDNGANT